MFRIASSTAPTSLLCVTALAQRFDRQPNCSASVGPLSSRCIRPHARERIPKETTKPAARAVAATSRAVARAGTGRSAPATPTATGPARGRRGPRASEGSEGAEIHGPMRAAPTGCPDRRPDWATFSPAFCGSSSSIFCGQGDARPHAHHHPSLAFGIGADALGEL